MMYKYGCDYSCDCLRVNLNIPCKYKQRALNKISENKIYCFLRVCYIVDIIENNYIDLNKVWDVIGGLPFNDSWREM